MKTSIEKVEFWLSNQVHILWSKADTEWNVTIYKHGCQPITILNIKKRPSLHNSLFLGKRKLIRYNELKK